jgi:hypothetical protein
VEKFTAARTRSRGRGSTNRRGRGSARATARKREHGGARARQTRGGGTGGAARVVAGTERSQSAHDENSGAATTGLGAGSKARRILAVSFPLGTVPGFSCCCFAAETASHNSQRPSGLKVRRAASSRGSVRTFITSIRPHAKVCTKSHWLPVASSHAAKVKRSERRRRTNRRKAEVRAEGSGKIPMRIAGLSRRASPAEVPRPEAPRDRGRRRLVPVPGEAAREILPAGPRGGRSG